MAKQTGLGSSLLVEQWDLSGDIGAVTSIITTRATLDVPDISQSAMARIMGRRDGSLAYTAYWDTAASASHVVLSPQARTDQITSVLIGSTVGSAAASMVGKQITYAPTVGADGSLLATVNAQANGNGLEWGALLTTGKQTFASGAINGTSIDFGSASSLFGAAAYIHVISLGSGTPTVTIADSADNATFATLSPVALAFSPTVPYAARAQTGVAATIRRYVRVQVSGTYTNLVAAVVFVRYTESIAT